MDAIETISDRALSFFYSAARFEHMQKAIAVKIRFSRLEELFGKAAALTGWIDTEGLLVPQNQRHRAIAARQLLPSSSASSRPLRLSTVISALLRYSLQLVQAELII